MLGQQVLHPYCNLSREQVTTESQPPRRKDLSSNPCQNFPSCLLSGEAPVPVVVKVPQEGDPSTRGKIKGVREKGIKGPINTIFPRTPLRKAGGPGGIT